MKTFIINGRTLNCEIKRSRRRTVALYVFPDKHVEIRVPLLYNVNDVEPFLVKHSRWLFNRLDSKDAVKVMPKRFVDGELHYFLGKQSLLKGKYIQKYILFQLTFELYHKTLDFV